MKGRAFCRVNALKLKIECLLKPIDNSMNSERREMLKLVYKQVDSFEELAKTTLNLYSPLDSGIVFEVRKLEGMVDEFCSKSESNEGGIQNLREEIHSFTPQLKMMEHKYRDGLYNTFPDDEEDDHGDVSSEMIGMREVYEQLKDMLMKSRSKVTSLVGMPGIGKTTLANKLFNDPTVVECFDHRVWVRVGKKYRAKDIPHRLLEEIDPVDLRMLPGGDEEAIGEKLKASLKSKKYLIVLDDVWDRFTVDFLSPIYPYKWNHLDQPFLHPECGSRILIISRLQQLDASRTQRVPKDMITMRLLNREESWNLFREKVFSQSSCPPQFEKAGKKISENCEGLPLTILVVARLLSLEEGMSNSEYWDEVATTKNHKIFLDAYEEISKVLLPSYTYLPSLLRMCFMFIGLFPKKYEVPRTKLINLWLADGFYELKVHIASDANAFECLEELVSNNLVVVYQHSSFNYDYNVKTCGLHSSLWHLSKKKARETKFALLLNSSSDGLGDDIEGHHRLSFNNNVLFGIKDVHKSVEDNCASAARSLFCFGPYHKYQVPLCFRLKFLKELDALSIRFYEFPMEVLQLVMLSYLSLTLSGMIPPSISQLQLLEFLIVDQHQHIKSCKEASYLPLEIWSLQKLKHLEVMGSDLPNPCGASLSHLSTLSNVSARSCTNVVLKGIPYLKNLKVLIELEPDDDDDDDGAGKPLICFGTHLFSDLCKVKILKCVIVNPKAIPPLAPLSSFAKGTNLTKLSLSGLYYPWEEMRFIASLPFLIVLKLKNYAFQGPEWEVEQTCRFSHLKTLVIEDTDLVDWKFGPAFANLQSLIIKGCYKLEKIHGKFRPWLQSIELVDCNPSCVEEMKKAISKNTVIDVQSSWEERKLKT